MLVRQLPAEAAHLMAVKALVMGIGPKSPAPRISSRLATEVAGLSFANPIGLAAGFDKNAEAIKGALDLGFGFVEVGTITPKPQLGNPKPRVFRLPIDGGVINRYGFNNDGMVAVSRRLAAYRKTDRRAAQAIIGVNIGANKDSADRVHDYLLTAKKLSQYADYIAVNVSSPNTPGLRGLQQSSLLKEVLKATQEGMALGGGVRPLMLKIAPDLDHNNLEAIIETALDEGCQGLIIANTTISRPDHLRSPNRHQAGGLSGRPLLMLSSQMLAASRFHLKAMKAEDKLPIIAAGGVDSPEAAYVKLLLGASLVQIYTGLVLKGPQLPAKIATGLATLLNRDGVKTLDEVRGSFSSFEQASRQASSVN
jgi:dihydroorotate dehydrogenase